MAKALARYVAVGCWVVLLAACRTLPPLAPVDLGQAGWSLRQGQAVWKPGRSAPEIAGEILVATSTNGLAFVQFTKTPFPLVLAQRNGGAWQIESPGQGKRYAGRGQPPKRLIWFALLQVISGGPTPHGWSWRQEQNGWRLENRSRGESLEGYFNEQSGQGASGQSSLRDEDRSQSLAPSVEEFGGRAPRA